MPRRTAITALAASLERAAEARDWEALTLVSRALARALPQLAAQGHWSAPETAALDALRAQHLQASARCAEAANALAARLDYMQANKDGWIAYAIDAEPGPDWTNV